MDQHEPTSAQETAWPRGRWPTEGGASQEAVATAAFGSAERLTLAAALLAIVFLLCNLVAFQYGRDQGIYAVVADRLLQGEAPYKATWDFKPPGVFFVFAAAQFLFGKGMHSIRLLEAAALVGLVLAFVVFARSTMGEWRAGILAGFIAVLTYVQLEFWHTAQPSAFSGVLLAWAIVCASWEPRRESSRSSLQFLAWSLSGALYSAAALLKPPLGGGILVSLLIISYRRLPQSCERSWRVLIPPALAMATGAALPLAAVAIYLVANDAWGDFVWTMLGFVPHYTALDLRLGRLDSLFVQAVRDWAISFSVVNLAGLLLLCLLPARHPREREATLHVLGVIAVVLLGVALQAKFFPYHYAAALSLGGLLAGCGLWKLWLMLRRRPHAVLLFATLLGVLIFARTATEAVHGITGSFWKRCQMRVMALIQPEERSATNDYLYSLAEIDVGANHRMAEWLRSHTSADASVYIWGFEPVIYFLAQRAPASRFIYNVPQRVSWARDSRDELMSELNHSRPAAIIVEHGDRFPWVTGNQLDSSEALQEFPTLQSMIANQYQPVARIQRFDIYLRSELNVAPR